MTDYQISSDTDPTGPTGQPQGPHRRPGQLEPDFQSNDPYAVLGMTRQASPREIKRAYFGLVREHPPEEDPETFKIIRSAYEKLRSAEAKAHTDLFLFQPPSPWEPRKRRHKIDLELHVEDVWRVVQQHGDLGRDDFQDDYGPIKVFG